MIIRDYESKDFDEISKWCRDEKIHALWCAYKFDYPLNQNNFETMLEKLGEAKVVCLEDGQIVGFFCYDHHEEDQIGMLKFVILSSRHRGMGYGSKMIDAALSYAKEEKLALGVKLNVFDINSTAIGCYTKHGFIKMQETPEAFVFQNEKWGRISMINNNL